MSLSLTTVPKYGASHTILSYLATLVAELEAHEDAQSLTLTVVGADLASAGTGTVTIQVVDQAGNAVAEQVLIRTWIGTADDLGVDALTDYSVSTGTEIKELTANAVYLVMSDATGKVVMAVNAGGADSVWACAEINGSVISSGEVVLTAP